MKHPGRLLVITLPNKVIVYCSLLLACALCNNAKVKHPDRSKKYVAIDIVAQPMNISSIAVTFTEEIIQKSLSILFLLDNQSVNHFVVSYDLPKYFHSHCWQLLSL